MRAPFDYSYADVMKHDPAGVVVSNGPGDPRLCVDTIKTTARLIESEVPDARDMPGRAGARACRRGRDLQAQVRTQGTEQAGRGPRLGQGLRHQPEPRLRGRPEDACRRPSSSRGSSTPTTRASRALSTTSKPCIAVQFHPEASPGPVRHRVRLRQVHRDDRLEDRSW